MQIGNRIAVTVYGAQLTGTITRANRDTSLIWVRMDGTGKERWFHRASAAVID